MNPDNKVADKPDGNLILFSQEEILARVPNLFLLLSVFNLFFHTLGIALLRTKPIEPPIENQETNKAKSDIGYKEEKDNKPAVYTGRAELTHDKRSFPECGDLFRPRVGSLNREGVSRPRNSFRISTASPWSSVESLLIDWPMLPRSRCCLYRHETCADKQSMITLPGSFSGTHMQSPPASGMHIPCRIDKHNQEKETYQAAVSAPNGDSKHFRRWSNAIRSGSESHHDSSCELNINAKDANIDNKAVYSPTDRNTINLIRSAYYGSTNQPSLNNNNEAAKEVDPENGEKEYDMSASFSFTPKQMVCTRMFFVLWVSQFCMDYSLSVLTNYYKLYGEVSNGVLSDNHKEGFKKETLILTMYTSPLMYKLPRRGDSDTLKFAAQGNAGIVEFRPYLTILCPTLIL